MRFKRVIIALSAAGLFGAAVGLAGGEPKPASPATPAAPAPAAAPAKEAAKGAAAGPFFGQVQAFIQTNCLECHGGKSTKGDIDFRLYKDEAALLKDRKTWQDVLEQVETGEMPPKKKPRPPAGETTAFVKAVHGLFEVADRGGKLDPGRVTARRLNRAEYNNTIRDLVGVDFQPAEDFPSDEVGYGFDNIGDVLSLSPF